MKNYKFNNKTVDIIFSLIPPEMINGLIVSALTQIAKKVEKIPVNEGQTGRIRTVVFGLSLLVTALQAFLDGNLATSNVMPILATSIQNFIFANWAYISFVKKV